MTILRAFSTHQPCMLSWQSFDYSHNLNTPTLLSWQSFEHSLHTNHVVMTILRAFSTHQPCCHGNPSIILNTLRFHCNSHSSWRLTSFRINDPTGTIWVFEKKTQFSYWSFACNSQACFLCNDVIMGSLYLLAWLGQLQPPHWLGSGILLYDLCWTRRAKVCHWPAKKSRSQTENILLPDSWLHKLAKWKGHEELNENNGCFPWEWQLPSTISLSHCVN